MFRRLGAALAAAVLLAACGGNDAAYDRAVRAYFSKGDVVVGVAWSFAASPSHRFLEGVQLALDEVNAKGGVMGRPMVIRVEDEGVTAEEGRRVARRFAADPDLVAVIGHRSSEVALPASIIYEQSGITFLSTGATDPYLTLHGFKNVFRLLPSDEDYSRAIAGLRLYRGYKPIRRAVIIHTDDVDGNSFATTIQYQLSRESQAMDIVSVQHFNPEETNFRTLLSKLSDVTYDVILLQSPATAAALLMRQAREMGITAPFIGKSALDTLDLWNEAGVASNGTMIATNYSPREIRPAALDFHEKFIARYGEVPDVRAARGYDAVMTLAGAMNRCRSTVPVTVQDTLRVNYSAEGVTGPIDFDENGDLVDEHVFFKVLRDGKFIYPEIH